MREIEQGGLEPWGTELAIVDAAEPTLSASHSMRADPGPAKLVRPLVGSA